MKKILCIMLSVVLILSFCACGEKKVEIEMLDGRWYMSNGNLTLTLNFDNGVLLSKTDDFEPERRTYVINDKTTDADGTITYSVTVTEEGVSYDEAIIVKGDELVFEGFTLTRLAEGDTPDFVLTEDEITEVENEGSTKDDEKEPTDENTDPDSKSVYDKDKMDELTGRWHYEDQSFLIDFEFYDGVIRQYYNGDDSFTMKYEIKKVTKNDDGSKTVSIAQTDETLVEDIDIVVNGDKMTYLGMDFTLVN